MGGCQWEGEHGEFSWMVVVWLGRLKCFRFILGEVMVEIASLATPRSRVMQLFTMLKATCLTTRSTVNSMKWNMI